MFTMKLLLLIQWQRWQRSAHPYVLIPSLFLNTIAKKYTEVCKIKGSLHIVLTFVSSMSVIVSRTININIFFKGPPPPTMHCSPKRLDSHLTSLELTFYNYLNWTLAS